MDSNYPNKNRINGLMAIIEELINRGYQLKEYKNGFVLTKSDGKQIKINFEGGN